MTETKDKYSPRTETGHREKDTEQTAKTIPKDGPCQKNNKKGNKEQYKTNDEITQEKHTSKTKRGLGSEC